MAIPSSSDLLRLLDHLLGADSGRLLGQAGEKLPLSFRFNPLKHSRSFQNTLLRLEGFRVREASLRESFEAEHDSALGIGRSLAHFLGHIYIQDQASMLPPILLGAKPGERVLDLCSAPGSKTSQIAAGMENRGILVANEVSSRRLNSLVFNLRRMGCTNAIVFKGFGEKLGNLYFEEFDRVLVDPPCSALGTLRKSPEVLGWWTPERTSRLAVNQQNLLQSGLKALKPGGTLVYSTCTLTPEENEAVVDSILDRFPVEVESVEGCGLRTRPGLTQFRGRRFNAGLERAIRIYPIENSSEGFFITRLRKTASFGQRRLRRGEVASFASPLLESKAIAPILEYLSSHFQIEGAHLEEALYWKGSTLNLVAPDLRGFPIHELPAGAGLPLAHLRGDRPKITTEGSHLIGHLALGQRFELCNADALVAFVNREPLQCSLEDSRQILANFGEWSIGHGLVDGGRLISRFPRTGWRFELGGG